MEFDPLEGESDDSNPIFSYISCYGIVFAVK